jgi:hypothetical protein
MPDDDPSLDVTLRLKHAFRYWVIQPSFRGDGLWRFEKRDNADLQVGESIPLQDAQAKRIAFEAEIASARQEGWA